MTEVKKEKMKTPISYYGGKQKLAATIIKLIPPHELYCEPFVGGAAVFFAKPPSAVEVINDTNREMINFYTTVQRDYVSLEKEIKISLHSRDIHHTAQVINNNPKLFSELKRAWAIWVLSAQSFASGLDRDWGYDIKKNSTSKKVHNKREGFTEEYAVRLQQVQIECTDALRIIRSRDTVNSFFYCDPPYYNSNCGHYDGYTLEDYEMLLTTLSKIEGKFLLSSYPSPILTQYAKEFGWHQQQLEFTVSVANNNGKPGKPKTEVLTANYPIKL